MIRTLLESKIHRATVTEANIEYEGSVTIDRNLLVASNMLPYEQVDDAMSQGWKATRVFVDERNRARDIA